MSRIIKLTLFCRHLFAKNFQYLELELDPKMMKQPKLAITATESVIIEDEGSRKIAEGKTPAIAQLITPLFKFKRIPIYR